MMFRHQAEATSNGTTTSLRDIWIAIRELGHNRKFFMSTVLLKFIIFKIF